MGHADKDMTDRYDKVKEDVQYRQDAARSVGVGLELPKALTAKPPKEKNISQSGVGELIGRQVEAEAIPC